MPEATRVVTTSRSVWWFDETTKQYLRSSRDESLNHRTPYTGEWEPYVALVRNPEDVPDYVDEFYSMPVATLMMQNLAYCVVRQEEVGRGRYRVTGPVESDQVVVGDEVD